jgi:hypothetical protein
MCRQKSRSRVWDKGVIKIENYGDNSHDTG